MAFIRVIPNEGTEAWKRTKPGIFSEGAMNSLSMKLNGEEEMNKEKWVCLCVDQLLVKTSLLCLPQFLGKTFKVSWLVLNAYKVDSLTRLDDDMTNHDSSFPPELLGLTCYGCAIWKSSKIIIAGGRLEGKPSDKVFIYDIISKTWEPPSKMNAKRGERPTVVVADVTVFVFGGHPEVESEDGCECYDTCMDHDCHRRKLWAECCHLHRGGTPRSWIYFHPNSRIPPHLGFPHIRSHAVYSKNAQILFWSNYRGGAFLFNYNCGVWHKFEEHAKINEGPQWSSTVVVFEDFLFWHYYGTIYAHDLLKDLTLPLYTLSRSDLFGPPNANYTTLPTFLVHAGKGKLCLFCWAPKNRIWYCTFLVQISHGVGPAVLHIVPGQAGFLKGALSVANINHALEISS